MNVQRTNGKVPAKKRLLTGLRPTGRFHLGNYVGTFEKDVELQNSGEYECFFLIADYHTLTTGYEAAREIGSDIREGVLDFLAVGIDPETIAAVLAEQGPADELNAAIEVLRRRLPQPPRDAREADRALGLLLRRGYELELAHDAIRAYRRR